jgi:hypothetical protein
VISLYQKQRGVWECVCFCCISHFGPNRFHVGKPARSERHLLHDIFICLEILFDFILPSENCNED